MLLVNLRRKWSSSSDVCPVTVSADGGEMNNTWRHCLALCVVRDENSCWRMTSSGLVECSIVEYLSCRRMIFRCGRSSMCVVFGHWRHRWVGATDDVTVELGRNVVGSRVVSSQLIATTMSNNESTVRVGQRHRRRRRHVEQQRTCRSATVVPMDEKTVGETRHAVPNQGTEDSRWWG